MEEAEWGVGGQEEDDEVLGADKKNAGCIRERRGGLGRIQKGRVSPSGKDRWASIALWDPRHAWLPKGGDLSSPFRGPIVLDRAARLSQKSRGFGSEGAMPFVDCPFSVQLLPLSQPLLGCLSVSFPPLCQGLYKSLSCTLYG